MINKRSVEAVSKAKLSNGFLKPLYESYCFSQIPNTILSLLGCGAEGLPEGCVKSGTYDRVILLLIDGFGWKFLEKHKERYPFLKRFFEVGVVSKLTSQFPSTTAAHITTLCSNQVVGEHGIYEWFMYEPQLERVVAPLLYAFAGEKKSLEGMIEPSEFFPERNFVKTVQKSGINCKIFQQESIANSVYSKWMFDGAERVGYKNWKEALTLLKEHLKAPGLFYLYFGDFDTEAHHHGVHSPEVEKALDRCFHALEDVLMKEGLPPSTALIVTADHGMIDINPKETVYLNQKFPTLESKLKRGADGHVLCPAGSCRDFFLHVRPEYLMEVFTELKEGLSEVAWVVLTTELVERGFFGIKGVSARCHARMGNLVILPKGHHSIWWYEKGRFEQTLHAMHGGLTPDELETIFLFLKAPTS